MASHDRLARHLFVVGTTPAPAKEVRVTGIGASLRARRRRRAGTLVAPIARARAVSAFWASLAWAVFGFAYVVGIAWVARGLDRSVGDIVLVVVAGQRLSQYIAQTVGELGFLRGVWLDSSLRLTWLEDYAAGARAAGDDAAAGPPRRRHPLRARLVPLPGHRAAGARRRRRPPAGRRGRRHRRRERRRQDDARQAARRDVPADVRPDHRRRRRPGDDLDAVVAGAAGGGVPGLLPLRAASPATASASATSRGSTTSRRSPGRSVEPVPTTSSSGCRPASTRSSARRGTTASRCRFGQWQKLALARGFMRDEPLVLVLDEPTAALDAETEHALFERYADASRDGDEQRAGHRARVAPLLDGPDGRPDRRPRRRPRRRGRAATTSCWPAAASTPSCSRSRPAPTADRVRPDRVASDGSPRRSVRFASRSRSCSTRRRGARATSRGSC